MELSDDEFSELLQRVRNGSQEAMKELTETYGSHVMRTIRRHLNHRIRNRFDSIDFAQTVWGTFFQQPESIPNFRQPAQLIAYLVRISRNKVIDECRKRLRTLRYGVSNEDQAADHRVLGDQLPGKSPTPSAILVAKERVEQLLQNAPSHYRSILRLRAGGATFGEIACETGLNERSIRRVLKRLESKASQ